MTDAELNEAVSLKLAGVDPLKYKLYSGPDYYTSISAAWAIVDFLNEHDLFVGFCQNPMTRTWSCFINDLSDDGKASLSSEKVAEFNAVTAPRALCEAFLKLP